MREILLTVKLFYYKMQHVLQNLTNLLQYATIMTI